MWDESWSNCRIRDSRIRYLLKAPDGAKLVWCELLQQPPDTRAELRYIWNRIEWMHMKRYGWLSTVIYEVAIQSNYFQAPYLHFVSDLEGSSNYLCIIHGFWTKVWDTIILVGANHRQESEMTNHTFLKYIHIVSLMFLIISWRLQNVALGKAKTPGIDCQFQMVIQFWNGPSNKP